MHSPGIGGSHSHQHSHSHGHSASPRNKKELWIILVLTAGYMVAEIIGGLVSGSLTLLADAGHMAIDGAAIALSLFAMWISQKPATDEKTFGFYRAEILAALVNGATLVAISIWIFIEAWRRLSAPTEVHGEVMTAIAAGGLLVNIVGLILMRHQLKDSLNIRGVWLHMLTDTLGSISTIVAGLMVWFFDWKLADPIISILIAALILYGSWQLVSECVNVLLEGVPRGVDVNEIKNAILAMPAVAEIHDLHVWTLTSGVPSLSAHVRLKDDADHASTLQCITNFLLEKHHIEHVTLQLEPPSFTHRDMLV